MSGASDGSLDKEVPIKNYEEHDIINYLAEHLVKVADNETDDEKDEEDEEGEM